MRDSARKLPPLSEHQPDLLRFQQRAKEQGWAVRLPSLQPCCDLPEPLDLGGASLGDAVVQLRRDPL